MALGAALFLNLHEFIKKNAAIRIIKKTALPNILEEETGLSDTM